MQPMQSIKPPSRNADHPETDIELQIAIERSFQDIVQASSESVSDAAQGKLSPALVDLAKRAASVGWDFDRAVAAIRELARFQINTDLEFGP